MGNVDEAERILNSLLEVDEYFATRSEAEALLAKINRLDET